MKNNNWIKVSRQIFDWEWYTEINVFKLFMHLILECNYTDKQWRGIDVGRGQLITGRKKLSVKTGLSEQEVRTATKKLLSTNEITIDNINGYSLYTVVNYNKWQSNNDDNSLTSTNETTNETTNNQPQLKKVKNEKIYINTTTSIAKLSGNLSLIDRLCKDYKVSKENINNLINKFCNWLVDTKKEIHLNDHDLFKHFESWIKKQDISEYTLDLEVKWFIDRFNQISKKSYKVTPTIKKLFAKQFAIGYTGKQMSIAIQNMYSSSDANSFHLRTSFKEATPEYILKNDNVNKYLNVGWSTKKDWHNSIRKLKRIG